MKPATWQRCRIMDSDVPVSWFRISVAKKVFIQVNSSFQCPQSCARLSTGRVRMVSVLYETVLIKINLNLNAQNLSDRQIILYCLLTHKVVQPVLSIPAALLLLRVHFVYFETSLHSSMSCTRNAILSIRYLLY